jgi:hypothetical protein
MIKANEFIIKHVEEQMNEVLKLAEKELLKIKEDTENLINVYTALHNMDKPK